MLTLSIQNLSVHFSGNHVINDVSATLHGGEMVAVVGRNGVGKTTLCGLLIQYLCESGKKPVLAVDADANSNLNEVLGVEIGPTLGELRGR